MSRFSEAASRISDREIVRKTLTAQAPPSYQIFAALGAALRRGDRDARTRGEKKQQRELAALKEN